MIFPIGLGFLTAQKHMFNDSCALPFWAAKNKDNNIGFITLTNTSKDTTEIHCYETMGFCRLEVFPVL